MGTLYIVGTPIGNLQDITLRALETLRRVDLIAAEDTRVTGNLLRHYGIHTPLTSYFEHNKQQKLHRILTVLQQEKDIALVSDAGMPGINDPGYELIVATLEAGWPVKVVPGPSAPIAALVVSGLPTDRFLYLGYVPRRAVERRKRLQQIRWEQGTLIFLETPHRLLSTLADTVDVLGGERRCAIARELTKIHEDIYRGTVGKALDHFRESPPRGEIVLLIEGNRDRGVSEMDNIDNVDKRRVAEMLTLLQEAGLSRSQAARVVAQIMRIPKRLVYNVENEL